MSSVLHSPLKYFLKKCVGYKEFTWIGSYRHEWVNSHIFLLNPLILREVLQKCLSGSMILLRITLKLRMILQNI